MSVTTDRSVAGTFAKPSNGGEAVIARYLKLAADQGHAQAQFSYACTLQTEDRQSDVERYMRKAAENGVAEAQYTIGSEFERVGNMPEAVRWIQKAADEGHPPALDWMGRACLKSPTRSSRWSSCRWVRSKSASPN